MLTLELVLIVRVFFPRLWFVVPALAGVVALTGCQAEPPVTAPPVPSAAVSPLETRVLARHDSLMVLTDRLFELRRRLQARRATLPASGAARNRLMARLDSATHATLRADDAMMDWMHAYHRPPQGTVPDSAVAYFTRQLRTLTTVRQLTTQALDSATAVLRPAPVPAKTLSP